MVNSVRNSSFIVAGVVEVALESLDFPFLSSGTVLSSSVLDESGTINPVRFQKTTSVSSVTAEAAVVLLWEPQVSLTLRNDVGARSAGELVNRSAVSVPFAVFSVDSVSVVSPVVVERAGGVGAANDWVFEGLSELSFPLWLPNWRLEAGDGNQAESGDNCDFCDHRMNFLFKILIIADRTKFYIRSFNIIKSRITKRLL